MSIHDKRKRRQVGIPARAQRERMTARAAHRQTREGFVHRQTVAAMDRRQATQATLTQAFRGDPILVAAPGQRLGFTP